MLRGGSRKLVWDGKMVGWIVIGKGVGFGVGSRARGSFAGKKAW